MSALTAFFTSLISPVTSYFVKREDRKQMKVSAEAKLQMAKLTGEQNITLTDAEWEAISVQSNNDSWKDELVTITFVLPIWSIMIGCIYVAFTGEKALLDGTIKGIEVLQKLGIDFGELTYIVVLAAVGIKATRKLVRSYV